MLSNQPRQTSRFALALAFCAVLGSGCATWQGPRIDPTGERLLVWPNEPQALAAPPTLVGPAQMAGPPVIVPPPGATMVAPAPAAPIVQLLPSVAPSAPFGNLLAPPVYSDPPMAPIAAAPLVASVPPPFVPVAPVPPVALAPALQLPPPPSIAAGPVAPVAAIVPAGCDYLQIMPTALVAPVGREMMLKARAVSGDGYLLPNQRVDWSVAPNSVGQFTEMGFRDRGQVLSWWEAPHKIDEWSATSRTAVVPITLNTATPDPNDDIPILRGESWVTLTSAAEGASVVTACAPWLERFNQASATIYWIDAQWVFNQTTSAVAGRPHTLTTTVMRRTDGAPLPGWIVRYDVSAGAALGYEGGSSVESTTDGAGRASVEVSPKDAAGGVTNVGITIVRPATIGPAVIPRLEVGRAATTITWGTAAAPAPTIPVLPPGPSGSGAPMPMQGLPGSTALPTPPPTTFQPAPPMNAAPPTNAPATNPYTPPAAATGKPRLEVNLGSATPEQVTIGQNVTFELTVTNRGDGVARHIQINDRFDRGLRHLNDERHEYAIKYTGMRDLAPNETETLRLTFQVVDGGVQCHEATVSADGADAVSRKGCVTARQAVLTIDADGPKRQYVGETAKFNTVVRNTGDVAATNIEIVAKCDAALTPTRAEESAKPLPDGGILLRIDRMEPGERRTFGLEALCKAPSNKACASFTLTADGGVNLADEACVEILAPLSSGAAGAAAAPASNDLQLTVTTPTNPARVGQKQVINVTIANAGQQVERQVSMRVLLPPELAIDATQIQPLSEANTYGQEVRFATIAELGPGQQRQYVIPVTPSRTGKVQVRAEIASSSLATPKSVDSTAIDILGPSP